MRTALHLFDAINLRQPKQVADDHSRKPDRGSFPRPARLACLALVTAALPAFAQVGPDGIDWVTVGAVGNQPWQGNGTPGDRVVGRGRVDYEYKVGRYEVTTAQWVEFMNAAFDRPVEDRIPHVRLPSRWGASGATPNTPGGQRWTTTAATAMLPTGGIDWRTSAIYCNWLHNGKSTDRSAFLSGAYEVSTFGGALPFGFSDQLTRSPGARYFVPSWDEWLKAAHYDPNKLNGDGSRGGWWEYSNGTNTPPVMGAPGVGETNAGPSGSFAIPLGAYPNTQSPWGLFDVSGGTTEWLEEAIGAGGIPEWRLLDGSAIGDSGGSAVVGDWIPGVAGEYPSIALFSYGFRVGAVVPAPAFSALVIGIGLYGTRRRRYGALDYGSLAVESGGGFDSNVLSNVALGAKPNRRRD